MLTNIKINPVERKNLFIIDSSINYPMFFYLDSFVLPACPAYRLPAGRQGRQAAGREHKVHTKDTKVVI